MRYKLFIHIVLASVCMIVLMSSCASEQDRLITKLSKLEQDMVQNGRSYTNEDWSAIYDEYEAILEDASYMDFTDEQMEQLGYLEGKCTVEFAKHLGNNVTNFVNQLKTYSDGFIQGLEDTVEDAIDGLLDNFMK